MRDFNEVVLKMLEVAKDVESYQFKTHLNNILVENEILAPEAIWDVKGKQVSDLLYNYIMAGPDPYADWFIKVLQIFTEKSEEDLKKYIRLRRKE